MNNLLSASSIFLAVLGLLYSSWYSEIRAALNEKIPKFKEDRTEIKGKVSEVYRYRIMPLSLGSTVLCLILLPDVVTIVIKSLSSYVSRDCSLWEQYSAVQD